MSLYYLKREPKVIQDKNPLLLLLHGYGSNEEDLFSFASELPEQYYVISVRAPHAMMYGSYAWYAINFDADENKFSDVVQAKASRELILSFIEDLKNKYPIDADNVTLIGFSQGAILSYAAALKCPEKIQRIAALSGYFNLEIADEISKHASQLKMFISHGTADQVIPVEWARKAAPQLQQMGIEITYKEYPVGHGVAPQNFWDMLKWLES